MTQFCTRYMVVKLALNVCSWSKPYISRGKLDMTSTNYIHNIFRRFIVFGPAILFFFSLPIFMFLFKTFIFSLEICFLLVHIMCIYGNYLAYTFIHFNALKIWQMCTILQGMWPRHSWEKEFIYLWNKIIKHMQLYGKSTSTLLWVPNLNVNDHWMCNTYWGSLGLKDEIIWVCCKLQAHWKPKFPRQMNAHPYHWQRESTLHSWYWWKID